MNEVFSSSHELQREPDWQRVFVSIRDVAERYGTVMRGGAGYGAPEEANLTEYVVQELPEQLAVHYPTLREITYIPAYTFQDEFDIHLVEATSVVRFRDAHVDSSYRILYNDTTGQYDTIQFHEPVQQTSELHDSDGTDREQAVRDAIDYMQGDQSIVVDHEVLDHVRMILGEDRRLSAHDEVMLRGVMVDVVRAFGVQ